MLERIARGWSIVKTSWFVLQRHPKLLVFPVVSGVTLLLLLAVVFAIGPSVSGDAKIDYARYAADNVRAGQPGVYVVLFAFYFACTFVVVFFNAAMIFCALQCFADKEPSLRSGLAAAMGRLPQILGWTFVAATVGLILDVLQVFLTDKLGIIGDLLGELGEVAWGVMTYFVVPVVVVDRVGPIKALKRSSSILRQTWGEAVGGEAGLSALWWLLSLPIIVVAAVGFYLRTDAATAVALAAIVVPYALALTVALSALGTIFRTGVYVYATSGAAPSSIDPAVLQGAFHET